MPIVSSTNFQSTSQVVPDLYINIVPPSTLTLNGVPASLAAFVGTASWGPVNTPVSFSRYADYVQNFGQLNARKYDMGTHVAIAVQNGANNLIGLRVSDGSDTSASVVFGSTALTVTAKYTGSQGNNISITPQTGSKLNSYRFVVTVPGFSPEIFDNITYTGSVVSSATTAAVTSSTTIVVASTAGIIVGDAISGTGVNGSPVVSSITNGTTLVASVSQTSISSGTTLTFTPPGSQIWANAAAAINNGQNAVRGPSQWVTAVAGSATTAPVINTTLTLSGGTDGAGTITSSTLIGSDPGVGMYALRNSGLAFLDLCDCDTSTSWTTIDSFALAETCYAIQVAPAGNSVAQTVTAKQTAGLDSYNSKLLHGDWLFWNDPINGVARLVSPQAFSIGRHANLTPQLTGLNKEMYGVSGSQKSGIAGSSNAFYAANELNTLVTNGIEVITNPGGGGRNIWTERFGHNSSSNPTIHLDSYTTLTNYIAKTLNAGLGIYLGRTINRQLFSDVTATLTQFSQTLAGAGLIGKSDGSTPYGIVCNTSNNPPYQIQQGILVADVQMSYLGIVEKFIVNLQNGTEISITNTTISNAQ